MQTFQDLIDELRRLKTDDAKVATRYIQNVEIQALGLFNEHAARGAGGIFALVHEGARDRRRPERTVEAAEPVDPLVSVHHQLYMWTAIRVAVAEASPQLRLCTGMIGGAVPSQGVQRGNRTIVTNLSFPSSDWERRLEDDCKVLAILHREATTADFPELTGTAAEFAKHINENPGKQNDGIAYACGSKPSYFRKVFREKLRPRGFRNVPGKGYYGPDHPRAKSCSATK